MSRPKRKGGKRRQGGKKSQKSTPHQTLSPGGNKKKKSFSENQPKNSIVWKSHTAKKKHRGRLPKGRVYHTLVSNTDTHNELYSVGGDNQKVALRECNVFDVRASKWRFLPKLPKPRTGHCCVYYDSHLIIFGGRFGNIYLNDLHKLNVYQRNKWSEIVQVTKMRSRGACTACVILDKMYIFGGVSKNKENEIEYLDNLLIFDLIKEKWCRNQRLKKNNSPCARGGHGMACIDNSLYIYGGRQGSTLLNDLYQFDTITMTWSILETTSPLPGHVGHSMCSFENYLIVWGGCAGDEDEQYNGDFFFIIDTDSLEWRKVTSESTTVPKGRSWHSCSMVNSRMFMFGGGITRNCFNHLYSSDFKNLTREFQSPLPSSNIPTESKKHKKKRKESSGSKIKVLFNGQVCALRVKQKTNFHKLWKQLQRHFGLPNQSKKSMPQYSLVYTDEENEVITIRSNPDLVECFDTFSDMNKFPRIEIIGASSAKFRVPHLPEGNHNTNSFQSMYKKQLSPSPLEIPTNSFRRRRNLQSPSSYNSSPMGNNNDFEFDPFSPLSPTPNDELFPSRTPNAPTPTNTYANNETNFPETETETEDIPLWHRGDLIGSGACGKVYKAMNLETGGIMAVKIIKILEDDEKSLRATMREISLMKGLKHPNIVSYYGVEKVANNNRKKLLNIFMEYVNGGSIHSVLKKFGRLSENVVRRYTLQILLGLQYLHSKNVVHRDIKGRNILVSDTSAVKLADFGSSRTISINESYVRSKTGITGTPFWMDPVMIEKNYHGKHNDVWALGCTIIEMLTGSHPWQRFSKIKEPYTVMFRIVNSRDVPKSPQNASPQAKDFLARCLVLDHRRRAAVDDLLRHPFITTSLPPEVNRILFERGNIYSPVVVQGTQTQTQSQLKRVKTSEQEISSDEEIDKDNAEDSYAFLDEMDDIRDKFTSSEVKKIEVSPTGSPDSIDDGNLQSQITEYDSAESFEAYSGDSDDGGLLTPIGNRISGTPPKSSEKDRNTSVRRNEIRMEEESSEPDSDSDVTDEDELVSDYSDSTVTSQILEKLKMQAQNIRKMREASQMRRKKLMEQKKEKPLLVEQKERVLDRSYSSSSMSVLRGPGGRRPVVVTGRDVAKFVHQSSTSSDNQ